MARISHVCSYLCTPLSRPDLGQDIRGFLRDGGRHPEVDVWHPEELQRGHHRSNTCSPTLGTGILPGICSQSHPAAGGRAEPKGNDPWAQIHRGRPSSHLPLRDLGCHTSQKPGHSGRAFQSYSALRTRGDGGDDEAISVSASGEVQGEHSHPSRKGRTAQWLLQHHLMWSSAMSTIPKALPTDTRIGKASGEIPAGARCCG